MRELFYILIVTTSLFTFGQNQTKNFMYQSASNVNFKPIIFQINSNKKCLFSNSNSLCVYNASDKLYYSYYNSKGNYELNTVKNFPKQSVSFSKIDSFDPNGAGDFKSAIIIGTLNFLFGKH